MTRAVADWFNMPAASERFNNTITASLLAGRTARKPFHHEAHLQQLRPVSGLCLIYITKKKVFASAVYYNKVYQMASKRPVKTSTSSSADLDNNSIQLIRTNKQQDHLWRIGIYRHVHRARGGWFDYGSTFEQGRSSSDSTAASPIRLGYIQHTQRII